MKKNSITLVSNKTPVSKVKLFHLYSTRIYSISTIGYFTLCSIRSVKVSKFIHLKRRTKMKNIISQTRQWSLRKDSTKRKFFLNSVILLKKNFLPLSNYMLGSTLLDIRRKKYVSYYLEVF